MFGKCDLHVAETFKYAVHFREVHVVNSSQRVGLTNCRVNSAIY